MLFCKLARILSRAGGIFPWRSNAAVISRSVCSCISIFALSTLVETGSLTNFSVSIRRASASDIILFIFLDIVLVLGLFGASVSVLCTGRKMQSARCISKFVIIILSYVITQITYRHNKSIYLIISDKIYKN